MEGLLYGLILTACTMGGYLFIIRSLMNDSNNENEQWGERNDGENKKHWNE